MFLVNVPMLFQFGYVPEAISVLVKEFLCDKRGSLKHRCGMFMVTYLGHVRYVQGMFKNGNEMVRLLSIVVQE